MSAEQKFLEVYDSLAAALWRHAYFRVSDREIAQDLVSETFLKAWDKYREKPSSDLKPLLYRILHNLIIDHYRKRHPEVSLDEALEIPEARKQDYITGDKEYIAKLIKQLPEGYRQVLIMRYIDDLSIPQIAQLLSKSSANVYVIIHRGLKALRVIAE